MENEEKVVAPKIVYLYSFHNGEVKIHKGELSTSTINSKKSVFKGNDYSIRCSPKQTIIFNSTLWLNNKNDRLAKNLFMENERKLIDNLQKTIKNHLNNIKTLRNTKEYDNSEMD